jgi:hypothetical protein
VIHPLTGFRLDGQPETGVVGDKIALALIDLVACVIDLLRQTRRITMQHIADCPDLLLLPLRSEGYSDREIIKRWRTAAGSKRFGTPGAPSVDTCPPQYAS